MLHFGKYLAFSERITDFFFHDFGGISLAEYTMKDPNACF